MQNSGRRTLGQSMQFTQGHAIVKDLQVRPHASRHPCAAFAAQAALARNGLNAMCRSCRVAVVCAAASLACRALPAFDRTPQCQQQHAPRHMRTTATTARRACTWRRHADSADLRPAHMRRHRHGLPSTAKCDPPRPGPSLHAPRQRLLVPCALLHTRQTCPSSRQDRSLHPK